MAKCLRVLVNLSKDWNSIPGTQVWQLIVTCSNNSGDLTLFFWPLWQTVHMYTHTNTQYIYALGTLYVNPAGLEFIEICLSLPPVFWD